MSEEHKEATRRKIEIMQAYVDGKPVEASYDGGSFNLCALPVWNWRMNDYRIATIPDSIDWSHVAPEWKYMARDEDGDVYFYKRQPNLAANVWGAGGGTIPMCFTSYRQGTVDWKDSLVIRPE